MRWLLCPVVTSPVLSAHCPRQHSWVALVLPTFSHESVPFSDGCLPLTLLPQVPERQEPLLILHVPMIQSPLNPPHPHAVLQSGVTAGLSIFFFFFF